MKRATPTPETRTSLDLVEEAIDLLRSAPLATLSTYYLGALPFVLGLLFFWADMSRSPFAYQHLAGAALGMAALFVWMKFWHAVFLRRLRAAVTGHAEAFGPGRAWRTFLAQAALQPTGLFLLPLSAIPVFPFVYVYAFYQNLSALADGDSGELRPLIKRSLSMALLWPRQNVLLLLSLSGFGLFVILNCASVSFVLPGLLKMLLGIESTFARASLSLLNTTFFAAMLGLAYLCVDPILKAAYALRCFYGESLQSGEDIKADLRQCSLPARSMAASLLLALMVLNPHPGLAALTPSETAQTAPSTPLAVRSENAEAQISPANLPPAELDRTIGQVIKQSKYTWRLPREKIVEADDGGSGIIGRFFDRVKNLLIDALKTVGRWLDALLRKLFGQQRIGPSGDYSWMMLLQVLLYGLIAAAAAGLIVLALRVWRNRRARAKTIASEPVQPAPDIADETVGAEQLPEDGWTRLGRELLERGELRLAMRAFFLAGLAHLAARNLISLARFKSNRDYERELRRRGHSFPLLLEIFAENLGAFEGIWYGMHEISGEQVVQFAGNVERLKGGE